MVTRKGRAASSSFLANEKGGRTARIRIRIRIRIQDMVTNTATEQVNKRHWRLGIGKGPLWIEPHARTPGRTPEPARS